MAVDHSTSQENGTATTTTSSNSIKTINGDAKPSHDDAPLTLSSNGTAIPTPASSDAPTTEASSEKDKTSDTKDTTDEKAKDSEPTVPPGSIAEIKSLVEHATNKSEIIELDAYLSSLSKTPYAKYALVARQIYDEKDKYEKTIVEINSPSLLKALKETVTFYPAHPLKFDRQASFDSPFMLLGHYRNELEAYAEASDDELTKEHTKLLIHFIDSEAGEKGAEAKRQKEANLVTFDNLWTIYRPGDLLYNSTYGHERLYRFEKADYQLSQQGGRYFELSCSYTSCDGVMTGQSIVNLRIWEKQEFVGLSPSNIQQLSVYPLKVRPEWEQEALMEKLKARGEQYLTIKGITTFDYSGLYLYLKAPPYDYYNECAKYDGTWLPKTTNERVVVDAKTFNEEARDQKEEASCDGDCKVTGKSTETMQYINSTIDPMLCPPHVFGFSLELKEWCKFFVDNLIEVEWVPQAMDSLILDDSKRRLVKSLVSAHRFPGSGKDERTSSSSADGTGSSKTNVARNEAQAKGKGLIILLHGTPGSGKTLTAELTAEHTHHPLLKISTGELGSWEYRIAHELKRLLTYAAIWHAIVLIDEADVFLEARAAGPDRFQQNNLVAVFLRQLEYFGGILFLTSNRVGVFDDAIQSRIHLSLQYEAPDAARRAELWVQNVSKIEAAEREEGLVAREGLEQLAEARMNGREIANAVNTARTLAEAEGAKLGLAHLQTVIGVWESFQAAVAQGRKELSY